MLTYFYASFLSRLILEPLVAIACSILTLTCATRKFNSRSLTTAEAVQNADSLEKVRQALERSFELIAASPDVFYGSWKRAQESSSEYSQPLAFGPVGGLDKNLQRYLGTFQFRKDNSLFYCITFSDLVNTPAGDNFKKLFSGLPLSPSLQEAKTKEDELGYDGGLDSNNNHIAKGTLDYLQQSVDATAWGFDVSEVSAGPGSFPYREMLNWISLRMEAAFPSIPPWQDAPETLTRVRSYYYGSSIDRDSEISAFKWRLSKAKKGHFLTMV
jgi:hypothetical protein